MIEIGSSIGRYHILEQLGQGGMAIVYRAYDTRLENEVALKILRVDVFGSAVLERLAKRFEREAKLMAAMSHRGIVKVIDYGEYNGAPYLVMELVPGGTLKDRMGKPFHYAEAARLAAQVARALNYAHQRQHPILHRDVKPANILVNEEGELVLSDFGIAKILEESEGNTLTGTGVGLGTPEYMAPEQGLGKEVDARADIYALGVVFFELVTGRKPFLADTPLAVLHKQVYDPLPRPKLYVPDLPNQVERVLFKALAKKPEDRYSSMSDFAAALTALATATEPAANQSNTVETTASPDSPPAENHDETGEETMDLGPSRLPTPKLRTDKSSHPVSTPAEDDVFQPASSVEPVNQGRQDSADRSFVERSPGRTARSARQNVVQWSKRTIKPWLIWTLASVVVVLLVGRFILPSTFPTETTSEASSTQTVDPTSTGAPSEMVSTLTTKVIPTETSVDKSPNDNNPIMILGNVELNQIAYSPDGTHLAAATSIGIFLFNPDTLQKTEFINTINVVTTIAFSPDGRTLASGTDDGGIQLWDAANGKLLTTLNGHTDFVSTIAFSPDGLTLASGSYDHIIKLWDATTGQLLNTLQGHKDSVKSVAYSSNGRILASGSVDNSIIIWDIASGKSRASVSRGLPVASVNFSPNGLVLASSSWEGVITLWEVAIWHMEEISTLKGNTGSVRSVVFSPDGHILASGSGDGTIKLWDANGHQLLNTLTGHDSAVVSIAISPNSLILASGSGDGIIKLWDTASGQLLDTIKTDTGNVLSVAFSPDGRNLASGQDDNSFFRLWDPSNGQPVDTLKVENGNVLSVAFSPDGRTLASGSYDNSIRLWDYVSKQLVNTLKGHTRPVRCVAFSIDGRTLASGSYDGTIKLWDTVSGQLLKTLEGNDGDVISVTFSSDGRTLASGFEYGNIRLWDATSGQLLNTLWGDSGYIYSVDFSPDGRTLASGSFDRTIKMWDVTSGKLLNTLKGHTGFVWSVAFSPDGHSLASGSADGTISLWDADSGALLHTLEGNSASVSSVAYSPDGQRLASGSSDGAIQIWDTSQDQ